MLTLFCARCHDVEATIPYKDKAFCYDCYAEIKMRRTPNWDAYYEQLDEEEKADLYSDGPDEDDYID